jgi:hypothetical protein
MTDVIERPRLIQGGKVLGTGTPGETLLSGTVVLRRKICWVMAKRLETVLSLGTDKPLTVTDPERRQEEVSLADNFLLQFDSLARSGQVQKTIDCLFDRFDNLLSEGNFSLADTIIRRMDASALTPVLLASVLSITQPARDRLPTRRGFYRAACQAISRQRGEEEAEQFLGKYL